MREVSVATPFGRRPMTLGQISTQMTARSIKRGTVIDKWQVFGDIREAKNLLGATDRSLTVLNALLSFHRDIELGAEGDLIVWPSNAALTARANGMPATTLRRHIAVLVDCGLVIRRDSPNGKRFARKGRGGEIEQAYGFDLAPIVARAEEFKDLAEAVHAEKKAFRLAKERLTLVRRNIVKLIDAGIEENVPGNWGRVLQTYQAIIARLPRSAPRQTIEDVYSDLHALYTEILEVLVSFAKTQNPVANESQSGRHIQNSKPDSISESKNRSGNEDEADGTEEIDNVRSLPKRGLPLGIVLDACPAVLELVKGGEIRHWRDLLAAAELTRTMLGISPSAWREAREVLGEQHAAVTLAAIYQKADRIGSAGGYLRNLTDRAREGKFSTWPMVMALLRAKLDMQKASSSGGPAMSGAASVSNLGLGASDALLRSLSKPKPQ